MIKRIHKDQAIDVLEFIKNVKDYYQDFYITSNNQRLFLTNLTLIDKVLKTQECYGLYEEELKGILIIYREKGYRPYIKILGSANKYQLSLIKFLIWNFSNQDIYIKLKKNNSLVRTLQYRGFTFQGNRGEEILLFRKGEKRPAIRIEDKGDN